MSADFTFIDKKENEVNHTVQEEKVEEHVKVVESVKLQEEKVEEHMKQVEQVTEPVKEKIEEQLKEKVAEPVKEKVEEAVKEKAKPKKKEDGCKYVFTRGEKTGQECGKNKKTENFCTLHSK